MEIDNSGFFAQMGQGSRAWSEREALRQLRFEETVVKRILTRVGLGDRLRNWQQEQEDFDGSRTLSLAWFNQRFPGFPVRLGAEKIPKMHEVSIGALFGPGFMKTSFMQAYREFLTREDIDDRNERAGLVFAWPHVPTASTMIVHTYPLEVDRVPDPSLRYERNTRIIRPFGNPPVVYVIDPLDEFLFSVGTEWARV